MSQLSLTLPPAPDPDANRFVLGPSNQAAVQIIESWPRWPGASLALVGPAGSGKSLLASIWVARAGAVRLSGASIDPEEALQHAYADQPIALEAPEALPEDGLFHLLNAVAERRGSLLLTHRAPPAQWRTRLPDLRSRLAALPVAALERPDDALLRAILVKKFSAHQLRVSAEVIDLILSRCERSAASVEAMATRLDAAALAQGRSITLALARSVLAESNSSEPENDLSLMRLRAEYDQG
jgi:chromosomal replication initiation ATPase DnaA